MVSLFGMAGICTQMQSHKNRDCQKSLLCLQLLDETSMFSRFYKYLSPHAHPQDPRDNICHNANVSENFGASEVTPTQQTTLNPQTQDDDIDELIHNFEGESLIIDESRSGPIVSQSPIQYQQYGTSFADAVDFNSGSSYKIVKFHSDQDFLIDLTHKNDYEVKINRFYLPELPTFDRPRYEDDLLRELEKEEYRYTIGDRLIEIEKEKKAKSSKLVPLSSEQVQKVAKLFNSADTSTVVVSNYSIDITVKDIRTLRPGSWLNDNIIDYYFNLISDQNKNYFSWTSHFFTTLKSRGYQGVKRWGKRQKLNLFEKELVFIPINISSTHWALSVINNNDKTIAYYDSLSSISSNDEFSGLHLIKKYMEGEKERLGVSVDVNEYSILPTIEVPQQKNGYDCGVFTLVCASYLAKSKQLTYGQRDMPTFRLRIAYEILTGKLL